MITINGVRHAYGDAIVLDEIDLTLPRGCLTSFVGPNGAGKSTLLSVVARLLTPHSGQVLVDGLDVATAAPEVIARRLAVLRQDNHITARLTVLDLVRFGRFPHCRGRLRTEDHEAVEDALGQLMLGGFRDRYLDQLSGGQRQRAFMAMVLAQGTDYVLLDEPLNNLDMGHAAGTMRMLRRACDELNRTVVLVLHDINFASVYSDHIVALRAGRVVAQGSASAIMQRSVLHDVFDIDMEVTDIAGHRLGLYWQPTAAAKVEVCR